MITKNSLRNILIFFFLLGTFAYFSQEGGWNQDATIGEIRAFAERGEFSLGQYMRITGDKIIVTPGDPKSVFSNKTPNMLFFAGPIYAVIYHTANAVGIDTQSVPYLFFASYIITFFSACIWGALLGLVLFYLLKELYPFLNIHQRTFLSILIPLSTQLFVYSTMAFVHAFETFWLVLTFLLFIQYLKNPEKNKLILLGLSAGVMVLSNPLCLIVIMIFCILSLFQLKSLKRHVSSLFPFYVSFLIPLIPLFIYNYLNFGTPFLTNRNFFSENFLTPGYLFGVFGYPDFSRIVYFLFKSGRALFPIQCHVLLFIPGILIALRNKWITKRTLFVFGVFTTPYWFMLLTFNHWEGGLGFGARYFTPLVIVLTILSVPIIKWLRQGYYALMIVSYAMLFIVTSTAPLHVNGWKKFVEFAHRFFNGKLSFANNLLFPIEKGHFVYVDHSLHYSYNLGQLMGLKGLESFLPLLIFQILILATIYFLNFKDT